MSTKFYVGQKDYIAKLNEADDVYTVAITAAGNITNNVAAAAASALAADQSATSASGSAGTATVQASLATTNGAAQVFLATAQVASATNSANAASTSAGNAAGSAAQALMVYSSAAAASAAIATAQAQSQLAQTAAASASSILQQDLSAVSAALHRSPNAVTAMCLYDTSKDSDGGAWIERMQHTSWANEPLSGAWMPGGFATELAARGDNLLASPEAITGGTLASSINGSPVYRLTSSGSSEVYYTGGHGFVPVVAGNTYAVSFEARQGTATSISVCLVTNGGVILSTVVSQTISTTGARITYTLACTNTELAQVRLTTIGAGVTVDIGAIKLNQVGVLPSTYSASPELVSNGGFDNGTVGWASAGVAASTASNVSGEFQVTSSVGYGRQIQSVACAVGKAYTISGLARTVSGGGRATIGTTANSSGGGATTFLFAPTSTATFGSGIFVATATTMYVVVGDDFNASGTLMGFDNISVKEVTTLATPYVPYSTQTNSYYQSSANGRFYKLGATYGALTEVFRGNTAKFPRLAMIVAEASNVNIYDLTQPGRPMWMRFYFDGQSFAGSAFGFSQNGSDGCGDLTSVGIAQGQMAIGHGVRCNTQGVRIVNFLTDTVDRVSDAARLNTWRFNGTIAQRQLNLVGRQYSSIGIGNLTVNAVAMTVLPDAPFDVATGLQVPTIAVATAGGVSVIKHDGTVVNLTGYNWALFSLSVKIHGSTLYALQGFYYWYAVSLIGLVDYYSYDRVPPSGGSSVLPTGTYAITFDATGNASKSVFGSVVNLNGAYNNWILSFTRRNAALSDKGVSALITSTHNTGYLVGDIRRAYLCNTEVGSVSGAELVTGDSATFTGGIGSWTSTGWPATLSTPGGVLRVVQTVSNSRASVGTPTVIGKMYEISGDVRWVSGPDQAGFGVSSTGESNAAFAAGTLSTTFVRRTLVLTATSTELRVIAGINGGGTSIFEYDNISVKEVIPDRSYKAAGASIYGTLVKSLVS